MQINSANIPDIYLQEISINDVTPTYMEWLNDPDINRFLETRYRVQNLKSIQNFVRNVIDNDDEHMFTIRTKDNNTHIGNIKIGSIDKQHNLGFVSLFIGDKKHWGKNYSVQAIQLISRYAMDYLLLRKLIASAYQPNKASIKAFSKAGYQPDAILKSHYLLDGVPCDLILVSLFSHNRAVLPKIIVSTSL